MPALEDVAQNDEERSSLMEKSVEVASGGRVEGLEEEDDADDLNERIESFIAWQYQVMNREERMLSSCHHVYSR